MEPRKRPGAAVFCYLFGALAIVGSVLAFFGALVDVARNPMGAFMELGMSAVSFILGLGLCAFGSLLSIAAQMREHLRAIERVLDTRLRSPPPR